MLGFIFGTVCLIGLFKVLRRARGYGGCGYHGYHGHHGGYDGRYGGRGSRWALRWLFERLETSPGQEQAIVEALDQLRNNRQMVREEMQHTREDLSRAVAGGLIDDHTLDETFARHDRMLAQLRVSFVEALKRVTETLDERQRKQAADMLQRGPWRSGGWGGPYRGGGMWA
jgi:hypothetical protein